MKIGQTNQVKFISAIKPVFEQKYVFWALGIRNISLVVNEKKAN